MRKKTNFQQIVLTIVPLSSLNAMAQETGIMPLYKAQVNFHESTGFELGLLALNHVPGGTRFVETSISVEAIFKDQLLMIPKL